jgi:DNA-binding GntR family transcriptional regulator
MQEVYMAERTGYADIAAHFRKLINDGDLAPGDVLPSMKKVCDEFGVSITTANRAFRLLKAEGITIPMSGIGTIVASKSHATSTGRARLERVERTGREYSPGESSTNHAAKLASCKDLDICAQLDVDPGDEVVIRSRVFRRDGRPTVVAISVIHPRVLAHVPEVLQQGQLKPFWQMTYRDRTGREVIRSPERRGARLASADELAALELDLPPNTAAAVLVLHTTFHDDDGPIEVWEDVHAPGLWQVATD